MGLGTYVGNRLKPQDVLRIVVFLWLGFLFSCQETIFRPPPIEGYSSYTTCPSPTQLQESFHHVTISWSALSGRQLDQGQE